MDSTRAVEVSIQAVSPESRPSAPAAAGARSQVSMAPHRTARRRSRGPFFDEAVSAMVPFP